jgi:hypothetical protein
MVANLSVTDFLSNGQNLFMDAFLDFRERRQTSSAALSFRGVLRGHGWTCLTCIFMAVFTILADTATAGSAPAISPPSDATEIQRAPYQDFIAEAAARFAIPSEWIAGVMSVESRGQVMALSPKGAIGLMQLMPDTWRDLRLRYGFGADPFDPHDNILAGAAYLRMLHDRYGTAGFLAAYNAGPARYEAYLSSALPLAEETRTYLFKLGGILPNLQSDRLISSAWPAQDRRHAPVFANIARAPGALPLTARQAASLQGIVASIALVAASQADGLSWANQRADQR